MERIIYKPGITEYSRAYDLQKNIHKLRAQGDIPDTLILLQHPPTITIGKFGKYKNILVSREQLEEAGISLFHTDRGGDVTFHAPGQLVAYPVINLKQRGLGIRDYICNLEEVIIKTLACLNIYSDRRQGYSGVWVKDEMLAFIGLSVKRWTTMHGFSINVNTDLKDFSLIKPCGFADNKVTSVSKLMGYDISVDEVSRQLIACFAQVFESNIETVSDLEFVGRLS